MEYLNHVRSYSYDPDMDTEPNETLRLLSLLPGGLKLNGPLFPNLQSSTFYLSYSLELHIGSLGSLLSPSVRSVHLHVDILPRDDVTPATTTLQFAARQGCDLHDFQYSGDLEPDLHSAVMDFKNLRTLHILISSADPPRPTIPVFDFLSSLPNLNSFYCDTQAYVISSPTNNSSSGLPCHDTLRSLDIYGELSDIEKVLIGMRFPLLSYLRFVGTCGTFSRRMKTLNQKIVSHSPLIRQMKIVFNPRYTVRPSFDDMTPLFSLRLESFHFPVDEKYTLADVDNIIKDCPHLHTLELLSEMKHDAIEMFKILSQHLELRECGIPADFGRPRFPLPEVQSKSRLEKLSFDLAGNIPTVSSIIEEWAKHILQSFPRIYDVSARYNEKFADEVQSAIKGIGRGRKE